MRKSHFTNSLFGQGLSFGLLLLILLQIPVGLITYRYLAMENQEKNRFYRNAVEELLSGVFKEQAMYGDMVNSRGSVLKQGEEFGLLSLGVCENGVDVLPKMDDERCKNFDSQREIQIFDKTLTLAFRWDDRGKVSFKDFIWTLLASLLTTAALFMLVIYLMSKRLSRKVGEVSERISNLSRLDGLETVNSNLSELRPLKDALKKLNQNLEISQQENIDLKISDHLAKVAKQVAHDIRSPLAALENVVEGVAGERSELANHSIKRIREIAEDLLGKNRELKREELRVADELATLIDQKRVEFPSRILKFVHHNPDGVIRVNAGRFRRIISNLINNSLEASDETSPVNICVEQNESSIQISVEDAGKGIPPELLKLLGQKEISLGKEEGNGLGLLNARKELESWGGQMLITSEINRGTQVTLKLPLLIKSESSTKFVLLDNDELVRFSWKIKAAEQGIDLSVYENWTHLKEDLDSFDPSTVFYIDSDLGEGVQGEELAKSLVDQGWENIFLCTGKDSEEFASYTYLRGVIGKNPPF